MRKNLMEEKDWEKLKVITIVICFVIGIFIGL